MSTQTSTKLTTLPQVNLLPPEINERKKLQQVQVAVAAVTVVAVGVVGFLDYQGRSSVSAARNDLATATAQNDKLVKTLATYNDVKTTAAQLNASEATLTQAMSTEVRWSEYFADFGFLPANTWLTKLTLTSALPAGSLLSPSQAPQQIGSVAVEGYAMKYGDLANWLDALEPEQGVSNVDFTKAAEQYIGTTKVVQFAGTAGLTSAALSGRCAKAGSC